MTSLLGSCRNGDKFQLSIFFPKTWDGIFEEDRVQSGDRLEKRVVPEPLDERVHAGLTLVEVIRIAPGWSEIMGGFQRAGTGKKQKLYRNFPPVSVLACGPGNKISLKMYNFSQKLAISK